MATYKNLASTVNKENPPTTVFSKKGVSIEEAQPPVEVLG